MEQLWQGPWRTAAGSSWTAREERAWKRSWRDQSFIPITLRRPVRPQTHHRVTECCTTKDDPKKKSTRTNKTPEDRRNRGERDCLPMEESAEMVSSFSFTWYQDTSWMYTEVMWILGDWIFLLVCSISGADFGFSYFLANLKHCRGPERSTFTDRIKCRH